MLDFSFTLQIVLYDNDEDMTRMTRFTGMTHATDWHISHVNIKYIYLYIYKTCILLWYEGIVLCAHKIGK